ncbi:uncharacterized protein spd-2 isoform X2 [Euwallacea fornicatus]|uniref:uncharacterized protein spd-2 isoform X2 n=1 Tax=Euwallacea fornicatus TaxID=995702 RepID=UPI00338F1BF0
MNKVRNTEPATPKNVALTSITTSTVDKNKVHKRKNFDLSTSTLESSLGILSLNNVDLSNIVDVNNADGSDIVEEVLKHQRQLVNQTLERASGVSGIPSRFLRPNLEQTNSESNLEHLPNESTVNDSDLIQTPRNTSTPRPSEIEGSVGTPRDSIFSKFKDMLDTGVSTDKAFEEFKQSSQSMSQCLSVDTDSFIPGDKAECKLLADEVSWRRKHDFPPPQTLTSFCDNEEISSLSIGEFFQQKSNGISVLQAHSPNSEPIALVDISSFSNQSENCSVMEGDSQLCDGSLSISVIQQLISEAANGPSNVMDYLLKQSRKPETRKLNEQRESSGMLYSLPVSRDTSYTSSFSDNEAVRVAANADKENVKPEIAVKSRSILGDVATTFEQRVIDDESITPPSRSSSSLTSLPNGKLPIESTVNELVWGCVKVDRSVTKHFMLRNKTSKTLRLQCTVSSYDFKLKKDNRSDSDHLSACKFVLHGNETRPLMVSFMPTKVGAATDELIFSPLDPNLKQTKKQCVRLWGYGGFTTNEYQNVSRDNTGKYWMSLGKIDNRVVMEQFFIVKNIGNIPSFTYIKVVPKHMVTFTNLKVDPSLFVLLPNAERKVKVTYMLTAKDCRILKQNLHVLPVVDIAKLEIVSGAEINRARLRRLNRKCSEKNIAVEELTKALVGKIGGELFPADATKFKESAAAITEILETLSREEMAITIEEDPNQTLVGECPEDSVIYQSLCQELTMIGDTSVAHKSCHLEPPSLVLYRPGKIQDCIFLISESTKKLHFEVTCSPNTGLHIRPSVGELYPGKTAELIVKLSREDPVPYFKIAIYVENDVLEAEVRVLEFKSSQNRFLDGED